MRVAPMAGMIIVPSMTAAYAAEDQAVLSFSLQPGMYATSDNPPCQQSLNISAFLADPKVTAISTAAGPKAKLILESTKAVLEAMQSQGGSIAGFVNNVNGGSRSQCESACAILPAGARIKEIKISGRDGDESRVSYLADGPNQHDKNAPNVLRYGGVLNAASMGDFSGYQGLQFNAAARSVCATAKNWSHNLPTTQTVRIIFDQ